MLFILTIEIIIPISAACVSLILRRMDLEKGLPLRANALAVSDL